MMGAPHHTNFDKQLREYFKNNPDEELTVEDTAAKFGVSPGTVYMRVGELQKLKVLEFVRVIRVKGRA